MNSQKPCLGPNEKETLKKAAIISKCSSYRYALWRIWDDSLPKILFIGLNPSTADQTVDDPTVIRCIGFARRWGFGGIYLANLFAFRTADPGWMKKAADPVGPENNVWLKKLASRAGLIIAAWGNHGMYFQRSEAVKRLIPRLHCLKLNKSGQPSHPLYLPRTTRPFPMSAGSGSISRHRMASRRVA
jgi:hypothetical protein